MAGYDAASLSTYAWVSQGLIAVVMIFVWTELADRVRTGDIAVDLARPVDLQLSWLAADLGRAAWACCPAASCRSSFGAIFFGFHWPTDPTASSCCRCRSLLAVCVSFACRFMVNLTAFWLTEVRGLVLLYVLVSGLLGGHLVPVQLFPEWLQAAAYVTPFPAMIQFPINLVTGQATGLRAVGEVAVQVAWAAGLLAARPARAVARHPQAGGAGWLRRRRRRPTTHWSAPGSRRRRPTARRSRSSSARRCSWC